MATKKRKKYSKKHIRSSKRFPFSFIFAIFSVIVLGFLVWLVPMYKVEGDNTQSAHTLGEDSIDACSVTDVITHGSRDKKEIALTFDADMTFGMDQNLHSGVVASYINRDLINILINTQTPATLFLTGLWIQDYPEDTKLLAENPLFELANHSYSHPTFEGDCYGLPSIGPLSMEEEIDLTQQILKEYTGVDNTYFRFPGGCVSQAAVTYLKSKGMQVVHWDTVGDDGFNDDTEGIIHNVLDHAQNGSIIVMHMNGYPNDPKTSEALPTIISTLKDRGYTFVKVSDLLQ